MATSVDKTNHIIVGLGGTGGKVLRAFKMRMFEEFPSAEERKKPISLLYVDTTREMTGIGRDDFNVMGQDASFTENEFLYIKGIDVKDILEHIDNYPQLKGLVDNAAAVKTAIGSLGEAAGQMRRAGRLLFAANANEYVNALKNAFSKCNEVSHDSNKTVHIIAGLCGGTGSGAIIDAIAQARKLWSEAKILVYVMIPEKDLPKPDIDKGRYYQNGYAAMRELNALQAGVMKPHDVTGNGERMELFDATIKGVANGLTVYSNANENGIIVDSFEDLPKIVSDYIYSRIFVFNPEEKGVGDIIRAYTFENIDGCSLENDETIPPSELTGEEGPFVRTKKINSFGIKRVIYPEMRILKHITYTTALSVLNQFEYSNWVENVGYVDEEINKDYLNTYLSKENVTRWMLDLEHITYDKKVLPLDKEEKSFKKNWQTKVLDWADTYRQDPCPPEALHNAMNKMFDSSFRNNEGVVKYFENKSRAIRDIAHEIRSNVEKELFGMWYTGKISITELKKACEVIFDYVANDIRDQIDETIVAENKRIATSDETLSAILADWRNVGFLRKVVMKKKEDYYVEYQDALIKNFTIRTKLIALDFAKELQNMMHREFLGLTDDVAEFSTLINKVIKETKELISKQQKKNAGLEDIKGAVVEVSEEESIVSFEDSLKVDKKDMDTISSSIREKILSTDFISFGDLLTKVDVNFIKNLFDTELSKKIKEKHSELPKSETKVLGLGILSQLKQKLDTEKKINEFAKDIMEQSREYLYLDMNQMRITVNNNDAPVSSQNIYFTEMFINIPKPDSPELQGFAKQLAEAFHNQSQQGRKKPTIFTESERKNELLIVTITYCFPMRAISWLSNYKKKYDFFLAQGNTNNHIARSILLHSEGYGKDYPCIFAIPDSELKKMWEEKAAQAPQTQPAEPTVRITTGATPPPMPGPSIPVPPPVVEPTVNLFLYIGGQQYGPYDWNTCKQFTTTKQLTPETLVWEEGMAAWTPAGQVPKLAPLFAPAIPPTPAVPPMPPTPQTPPIPPIM
ncbi:MAG: DUF4339 domain-containing protein [Prevotella sp.]|nr:DUF4339 domain-containing protein [Prevotella sp.]